MRAHIIFGATAAMGFAALAGIAHAQDGAAVDGALCSQISDPQQRLACFDRAFPKGETSTLAATVGAEPAAGNSVAVSQAFEGSSGGRGDAGLSLKAEAAGSYLAMTETSRGVAAGSNTTGDLSSSLSTFAPMLEVTAGFGLDYGDRFGTELRGFYGGAHSSSTTSASDFGFGAFALSGIQSGGTRSTGVVTVAPGAPHVEMESEAEYPSDILQYQEAVLRQPVGGTGGWDLSLDADSSGASGPVTVTQQIDGSNTVSPSESARGFALSATERGYSVFAIGDISDRLTVKSEYASHFSYWGVEPSVVAEFEAGSGLVVTPSFGPVYRGIAQDTSLTTSIAYNTQFSGVVTLDSVIDETFRTTYLGAGAGLAFEKRLDGMALTLGMSGGALGAFTDYDARETFTATAAGTTINGSAANEERTHTIALFGRVNVGAAVPLGPGEFSIAGQLDYLSAVPVGIDGGVEVSTSGSGGTRTASAESGSLESDEALRQMQYEGLFGYGIKAGYRVRF